MVLQLDDRRGGHDYFRYCLSRDWRSCRTRLALSCINNLCDLIDVQEHKLELHVIRNARYGQEITEQGWRRTYRILTLNLDEHRSLPGRHRFVALRHLSLR